MELKELRQNNELVDLFCTLAEIPSPSLKEEKVIDWICQYCEQNNMECEKDDFNNIYIKIAPTDTTKEPIMLSAHMDVIGDDSEVITYLDGDLIRAKDRTLVDEEINNIMSKIIENLENKLNVKIRK